MKESKNHLKKGEATLNRSVAEPSLIFRISSGPLGGTDEKAITSPIQKIMRN